MNVSKSETFLKDAQLQYEWYAMHAGWDIAERYFDALQRMSELLGAQPMIGPAAGFEHPRLRKFRFAVLSRPFHAHLVFYTVADNVVVLRRTMHGRRDLARRLLQPPGVDDE